MVSVFDCGSNGLGLSPGLGHCIVFLDRTLDSHRASLSTLVCKWVPMNVMPGVTL